MFKKIKRIHFVGIGGSGMSGIAEVLISLGYQVSGSDLKPTEVTERLASLGARIGIGHEAKHLQDAQVVVTSTAVSSDNPEVIQAKENGIPVIPRIEMLAELARLKYTIAIAGTHGKTTTTSMVGAVLYAGGTDPTIVVGGRLKHLNSGARLGKGEFLVAEADESDGSFLKLSPTLGVITNIDNDHLDYYGTFDKIVDAFVEFAGLIPFYGTMLVCLDDPVVQKHLSRMTRRVITYGIESEAQLRAQKISVDASGCTFEVILQGKKLGPVLIHVPGRHNVLNALAAIGIGLELEIPFEKIVQGLAAFEGVGRRMEMKGHINGVAIIDDYGHHPTEIRATLQALRDRYPKGKVVVLFQPHRFSRTQSHWKEFSESFSEADRVHLLDIYAAGEKAIPGVTTEMILKPMNQKHPFVSRLAADAPVSEILDGLGEGDVVLTLGAGDVWKWGDKMLNRTRSAKK